jgi:hypothetical protein
MKTCREVGVQLHTILSSAVMEESGQLHAPVALSRGKNPLNRRQGGSQSRSGHLSLYRVIYPDSPVR